VGTSKTEEFSKKQNRFAELAKCLSHPARIAILEVISKRKACICSEIVEELPLSQATVSQHLKEMKRIGILKGEVSPPKVCYCVNEVVLEEMKVEFNELFLGFTKSCC
jgi:ArsR family transcriptional regulator, arsenate/arsenite/antimonite-responsive transcriptional repressor